MGGRIPSRRRADGLRRRRRKPRPGPQTGHTTATRCNSGRRRAPLHEEGVHVDVGNVLDEFRHRPPYPFPTLPPVLARLFLVRHGEVHNPRHLCYGNLPGFGLSRAAEVRRAPPPTTWPGRSRAAPQLPLAPAQETAAIIGGRLGLRRARRAPHRVGAGLPLGGGRVGGTPDRLPGELEATSDIPPICPSPGAARRCRRTGGEPGGRTGRTHPGHRPILISHQDPLQAARLRSRADAWPTCTLTSLPCLGLTLEPGPPWRLAELWRPPGPAASFPPSPVAERRRLDLPSPPPPPAGREARRR